MVAVGVSARSLVVIAAVATLAVSCGGDDVTADNIGTKLAKAFCGAEARCCQKQGAPLSASDMQLCELTAPVWLSHVEPATFNPAVAAECLKAAQAYQCFGQSDIYRLCQFVFYGTLPLGGDCLTNVDCAQPPDGYVVCRLVCEAGPLFGREGAPCPFSGFNERYTCAWYEGLTCVQDAPNAYTGTCRKVSTSGGTCRSDYDCVLADYCDTVTLVCTPRKKAGDACDPTWNQCEIGLACPNGICMDTNPAGCSAG
jgi:hypothetical protein